MSRKILGFVLALAFFLYGTTSFAGDYTIYEDKGQAAAWEWFEREVVVKCSGGKNDGSFRSVYLNEQGKWEISGSSRKFTEFSEAASYACDL